MELDRQDAVLGGQNPIPVGGAVLGGLAGLQRQYEQGQWREWGILFAEAILHYGLAGVHWLAEIINWHNIDELGQVLEQSRGKPLQLQQDETVKVNKQGEIIERTLVQNLLVKEGLGNGRGLELVAIPGGSFLMGTPESDFSERPQHAVTVKSFWLGKYTVTQAQWRVVAGWTKVNWDLKPDPSHFKGDNRPMEHVSWHNAVEFCNRLAARTGRSYRLPTEAEWEYACRAGTTTPFHFGETITTDLANFNGNNTYGSAPKGEYRGQTTEVGRFPPNAFGLYDMHGNVWEWCQDHWHQNYEGAPIDGSAWLTDDKNAGRVVRGGSWDLNPRDCRSASRFNYLFPDNRYYIIGFRVVVVLPGRS